MIIKYTALIGKPVIDLQSQIRVGEISDFILDGNDFGIKAIIIIQKSIFAVTKKIIASIDIVHILKDGVIIENETAISELSELPRIEELFEKKFFGIGQKVETESNSPIGYVYDYLIDNKTLSITKFYTKKLFDERILPVSKVISFEGRNIIIKDDSMPAAIEKTAVEAAVVN